MALGPRDPRQRNRDYLGFIARLPCLACLVRGDYRLGVQVAHVRASYPDAGWRQVGKAEKPHDWRTIPLCVDDHLNGPDAQHKSNEAEWYERMGIYPPAICAELRAAYENHTGGSVVIARFAARARRETGR